MNKKRSIYHANLTHYESWMPSLGNYGVTASLFAANDIREEFNN